MAVTLGLYKAHFWTWTNSWEEFKQVRGLGPMEPSWGGLLAPGLVSWEPPEVSWEPPEGVLGQVLGAGLREEKGCAMPVPTKSVTSPCRVSDAQGLRQEGGFVCGCDLLHLWAKPTRSAQGHSSAPWKDRESVAGSMIQRNESRGRMGNKKRLGSGVRRSRK